MGLSGRSTSSSSFLEGCRYRYHINTTKSRQTIFNKLHVKTPSDTPCNPRALITRSGGAKYDIFPLPQTKEEKRVGRKKEKKKLISHSPPPPTSSQVFTPAHLCSTKKKKNHDNNNSPHRPPPPELNLHPHPPDLRALHTGIHPPNGLNRPIPLNPNPLTPVLAPAPDAATHASGGGLPPAHAGIPQHGRHPLCRVCDCRAVGLWVPELRIH
ncbi:hypothetical protein HOY80DRAFT_1015850 [Tuber brumale]|nr:hypothetical protein HOY80DRAFT_1015850 [Tuber brumale]